MATIYDSITVSAMPPAGPGIMYLGYVDGNWPTYAAVKARFPNSVVLSVTTTGFTKADICDCESGDATPAVAAAGVRDGLYKTVYANRATLPELVAAMGNTSWHYFAADWTGKPHLVPGSVATQYADPVTSGGNYDISVTDGVWPGTPAPTPAPMPAFADPTMEILVTLAASPTDALNAYIRQQWATFRTDTLTVPAVQYLQAGYSGPWHGSIDAVLACIIDTATTSGHLRPMFAGAA